MPETFAETFESVRSTLGPLVLGADPHRQMLRDSELSNHADGPERFSDIVLRAAVGTVGLIKPQSAFSERHDELTGVLASSLAKHAPDYTSLGFPDPRKLPRTLSASPASPA